MKVESFCRLVSVISISLAIIAQFNLGNWQSTIIFFTMSCMGYLITKFMIPKIQPYMIKAEIYGLDINKKGTQLGQKKIPESLGLVSATVFIIISFAAITLYKIILPQQILTDKFAALVCIVFSVLLGFVDDILDIPWRYKLIIPLFGILPVLIAYDGVTYVLLPNFLRNYLGNTIHLGVLYHIYMAMLGIFSTNSINIYAGINGLQVSQSIIIACSILIHNSIELMISTESLIISRHIFSVLLLLPYIFVSLALLAYNKYPSKVFVGDTFCYFSGMVFATVGILGHFSKTLLLMFFPQIINFVYSLPQLFGYIPCPKHRLPKYNTQTQKLQSIKSNLNMINLVLWITGPLSQERLCQILIYIQVISSLLGFGCRYLIGSLLFA